MPDETVVVFNHHQAGLTSSIRERAGVLASRSRVTVKVTSEPMIAMLDEGAVARRAAEVLAERVREQTQQITAAVKPSTLRARRSVERAFYKAKPWAWRRFDGGRMGVTPPRTGTSRMFNHSGRLAKSITANYSKKSKEWFIRYAANRWRIEDFRSGTAMRTAFQSWVDRVPVLLAPGSDIGIQRAMRETMGGLLEKERMGVDRKVAMRRGRAIVEAVMKASGLVTSSIPQTESDEDEEAA